MAIKKRLVTQWYGTASELAASNPVMYDGDMSVASDTGAIKIGDGSTAYNSLGYPLGSIYLPLSGGTLTGNLNGATPTEIGYLSGVTSAIQTQINNINLFFYFFQGF